MKIIQDDKIYNFNSSTLIHLQEKLVPTRYIGLKARHLIEIYKSEKGNYFRICEGSNKIEDLTEEEVISVLKKDSATSTIEELFPNVYEQLEEI